MSIWIVKNNIAIAVIPKNGSTSLRNFVGATDIYDSKSVMQFNTRIAFIREPFDRLGSAYSFFKYLNDSNQNGSKSASKDSTRSYENFVDHTFEIRNMHWNPQVEVLYDEGVLIPTHVYRLHEMHDVWERHFQGIYPALTVSNKASRLPVNDYRSDEIKKKYKGDLSLWHSL